MRAKVIFYTDDGGDLSVETVQAKDEYELERDLQLLVQQQAAQYPWRVGDKLRIEEVAE